MPESTETPNEKLLRILEDHAACLAVHFDTVRIFCSRQEGRVTLPFTSGSGNYFAQAGQVREWLTSEDEMVRQNTRSENG